ncbi:MAG: type I phosphomannose isomerase catalytic subunit [Tepidisphaeraceae bacterium]
MSLYPLKFKPRFVQKMWGGRKIQTVLGKSLPQGQLIGESWEIYDFPPGTVEGNKDWLSSEVANGSLAGRNLHQLVLEYGKELVGNVPLAGRDGQFPILIKFLDAREDLSVQVHPDEKYAAEHPDAHLKSEAWYIVQADPGARLLKGLRPGVTRESFQRAIADGTVESRIQSIRVKEGDCYYLPSGTVHALGAGILAAEVQTPSDTTFRVFDFNRIEPATGKLRKLHVEEAMQCIDFADHIESLPVGSRLVTSDYFNIERWQLSEFAAFDVELDQPVIWIFLEGNGWMSWAGDMMSVTRGETVLWPASVERPFFETVTDCTWLQITFPRK